MKSFPKVQGMFLFCVEEEMVDKEEFFFLLFEAYSPYNLLFPHYAYEKFSLVNKNPAECKADFRVEKMDIPLLVDVLGVPSMLKCRFGTICEGTEGLCNNACIRESPRGHGLNAFQLDKIVLFKVSAIFSHMLLLCMDPFFVWVLQWQFLYPG